jgi:hypothetical protein
MDSVEGHVVPVMAESGKLARGNIGNHGVVTEGLPLVDIGQMDFYNGTGQQEQCVPQRNRGMGQSPRVDDNTRRVFFKNPMDFVQYHPFMVGLKKHKLQIQILCGSGKTLVDLIQAEEPVYLGFPFAQHIQIRAIYHIHPWFCISRFSAHPLFCPPN